MSMFLQRDKTVSEDTIARELTKKGVDKLPMGVLFANKMEKVSDSLKAMSMFLLRDKMVSEDITAKDLSKMAVDKLKMEVSFANKTEPMSVF